MKFQYSTEFQSAILKHTLKDPKGYRLLPLYKPEYFDLVEHQVIAHAIKSYFDKHRKTPNTPVTLSEILRKTFLSRDWVKVLTEQDRARTLRVVSKLYKGRSKDNEEITVQVINFAKYVALRETIEDTDITDFTKYEALQQKIKTAISIGAEVTEEQGTFLLRDIKLRQIDRKIREENYPMPWTQLDNLTNSGKGYYKGAVFAIMDKAKGFKTGFLVNIAKAYLRQKRQPLIIDIENSEDSLSIRLEQSISKLTKKQVLSGEFDQKVQKAFRKWRRLKNDSGMPIELLIKRLPAYCSTDDIQYWIDFYREEHGIIITDLIIDYAALMASTTKQKDDFSRISDVYLDIKNLALKNNIYHTWTANHVVREAAKRRKTKYEQNDLAKCIDIHRHVDGLFGIQQNEVEAQSKIYRFEIIDQRDGYPDGRGYFYGFEDYQLIKPLNKEQVQELEAILKEMRELEEEPSQEPSHDDL